MTTFILENDEGDELVVQLRHLYNYDNLGVRLNGGREFTLPYEDLDDYFEDESGDVDNPLHPFYAETIGTDPDDPLPDWIAYLDVFVQLVINHRLVDLIGKTITIRYYSHTYIEITSETGVGIYVDDLNLLSTENYDNILESLGIH